MNSPWQQGYEALDPGCRVLSKDLQIDELEGILESSEFALFNVWDIHKNSNSVYRLFCKIPSRKKINSAPFKEALVSFLSGMPKFGSSLFQTGSGNLSFAPRRESMEMGFFVVR